MVNQFKYIVLLVLGFAIISCGDDDNSSGTEPNPTPPPSTDVTLNNPVNEFVWKGLNSWYYFLDDVENLNDSKDDNTNDFYTYLNGFSTPEALFNSLIVDDFSIIADNFEDLESGFRAVYNSFGYDFILYRTSNTQFIGQIRYVFPGSGAEEAGLKRGDAFTQVDGQNLTTSNIETLLFTDDSYTLTMADIERINDSYSITPTGEEVQVNETNEPRTAVWMNEVIDLPNHKVGYLVYSNFESTLHGELNDAFGEMKAAGVTDLVLDLRYNPGGSVQSAIFLNSMIYSTDTDLLMGSLEFNRKHTNSGGIFNFADEVVFYNGDFEPTGEAPLNSLGLSRLFVLTSSGTASASEFVINALNPYMDVIIIGETTVGKNVGSVVLYDTPPNYRDKEAANSTHTYAMRPIVSKIANSVGFTDYEEGFTPNHEISESDFLHDLKPLGDTDEQLLSKALELICPTCRINVPTYEPATGVEKVFESNQLSTNYQIADVSNIADF